MHDLAAVPDEHRNPGDTSSLTHGMVLRSADDGCHRAGSFGRSVENRAISVAWRTDRFALSRVNRGMTHLEGWPIDCTASGGNDWRVPTIVSWNLAEASGARPIAWEFLQQSLNPDLALVQEARVPQAFPRGRVVCRPSGIAGRDGGQRPWGSAIVSFSDSTEINPIGLAEGQWRHGGMGLAPIDAVSRGHVAIARVKLGELEFTAISAYGLIEFGYSSGTMLRTIADLEPLFDDPQLGDNVLLAGDWNIGTWWTGSDAKYARREGAILELLGSYDLIDCLDQFLPSDRGRLAKCACDSKDCRHVDTHKKAGSDVAYMDDYLFATAGLVNAAAAMTPWDWDSSPSDHLPLVATV
jgi:hypothetical protein